MLTKHQLSTLSKARGDWFAASDILGARPGNVCSVLADKGLLDRRSDPGTWGRSLFKLNAAGTAALASSI